VAASVEKLAQSTQQSVELAHANAALLTLKDMVETAKEVLKYDSIPRSTKEL